MVTGLLIVAVIAALALAVIVIGGYAYNWQWTGLPAYPEPKEVERRPVTFWSWLSLMIIPTSVALGTLVFTQFQHLNDMEIERRRAAEALAVEERRAKAAALREYLDRMQGMLIEHELRAKTSLDLESEITKAHTLVLLDVVGPQLKGIAIRFLHEAELLNRSVPAGGGSSSTEKDCSGDDQSPIVRLDYADLEGVDLAHRYLANACFENVVMREAEFAGAALDGASFNVSILEGADLKEADLSPAELPWGYYRSVLTGTDLRGATLTDAALHEARMAGAHLQGADLRGAVMTDADLSGADLRALETSSGGRIATKLKGADVEGVAFEGAFVQGVDLSGVKNLEQDQLARANGDQDTRLPRGLCRPASWIGQRSSEDDTSKTENRACGK